MLKPADLREHLTTRIPELARDPERLRMWIDKGTIRSRQTASLAFQYGYRLNVVVLDWTEHTSILFVMLVDWVRRNQPDLVASQAAPGFSFEADILDKDTIDLSIEIDLTETVGVMVREDGGWDMQHHVEPAPMFPDDEPILPSAPTLSEIRLVGAPGNDPLIIDGGESDDAMAVLDGGNHVYRRFQIDTRTAAQWAEDNPILLDGEPGLEEDTRKVKYGDGQSRWLSLPYSTGQVDLEIDNLPNMP